MKQYIVRKYIMAKSAKEAIKLDNKSEVDDCWVDEDWKAGQYEKPQDVGFKIKK